MATRIPEKTSTPGNPPRKLPVTINFACGASYAIRQQHKALALRSEVAFEYIPWQEKGYRPSADDLDYVQREGHGTGHPRHGAEQSRALAGIAFARANGREGEYVDGAFEAARGGEDLGDEQVLRAIAARAGLDATRFLSFVAKEGQAWAKQAQENAARVGATRTATYLVPGKDGSVPVLGHFTRAQLERMIERGTQ